MDVKNPKTVFDEAEKLHQSKNFEEAAARYLKLTSDVIFAPFAHYRLAGIANESRDPLVAKDLYYKAFSLKPDICKNILAQGHPNHNYIFPGKKDEALVEKCPLCGVSGEAYWCYSLIEMGSAHVQRFNPVRVWMRCDSCNHLFAEEFPELQPKKDSGADSKNTSKNVVAMPTKTGMFPYYSEILSKLARFTEGNGLLEIGFGGAECLLAAREMAFDTFGIEISEGNTMQALKYGLNAERHNFAEFETNRKWDIIIMGDVIEHVPCPVQAIEKAYGLLNDNGVLWISTPNFESAFSTAMGHADPMRREAGHKNYFSRFSLFKLLERFRFIPVDYRISSHYNGSMEVIVIKESYINHPRN